MATLALLGGQPVRTRPFPPWPEFGAPEEEAMVGVLRSGHWGRSTGSRNEEFERRFAAYQHAARAVTCVNGTVALELALRAAGIGCNDEVIVPSYTFIATASAVLDLGAVPVFADMNGILALARQHGLVVIEDAAQAHGAEWKGHRVGTIGTLGTFSFQSTKVLTAGEGGAVVTNDATLAEIVWSLQNVGRIPGGEWCEHHRLGWNLRMTEYQAALLLAQMDRLDEQIARRARNAAVLDALLREIEGVEPLTYPPQITRHPRYLYVFRYRAQAFGGLPKSRFVEALVAEGIPATPGYPPLHTMSAITETLASRGIPLRAGRNGALPATERAWKDEAVWLPQTVLLGTREDVADVGRAVRKIATHHQELR